MVAFAQNRKCRAAIVSMILDYKPVKKVRAAVWGREAAPKEGTPEGDERKAVLE